MRQNIEKTISEQVESQREKPQRNPSQELPFYESKKFLHLVFVIAFFSSWLVMQQHIGRNLLYYIHQANVWPFTIFAGALLALAFIKNRIGYILIFLLLLAFSLFSFVRDFYTTCSYLIPWFTLCASVLILKWLGHNSVGIYQSPAFILNILFGVCLLLLKFEPISTHLIRFDAKHFIYFTAPCNYPSAITTMDYFHQALVPTLTTSDEYLLEYEACAYYELDEKVLANLALTYKVRALSDEEIIKRKLGPKALLSLVNTKIDHQDFLSTLIQNFNSYSKNQLPSVDKLISFDEDVGKAIANFVRKNYHPTNRELILKKLEKVGFKIFSPETDNEASTRLTDGLSKEESNSVKIALQQKNKLCAEIARYTESTQKKALGIRINLDESLNERLVYKGLSTVLKRALKSCGVPLTEGHASDIDDIVIDATAVKTLLPKAAFTRKLVKRTEWVYERRRGRVAGQVKWVSEKVKKEVEEIQRGLFPSPIKISLVHLQIAIGKNKLSFIIPPKEIVQGDIIQYEATDASSFYLDIDNFNNTQCREHGLSCDYGAPAYIYLGTWNDF